MPGFAGKAASIGLVAADFSDAAPADAPASISIAMVS
jgi:hypothetical protein